MHRAAHLPLLAALAACVPGPSADEGATPGPYPYRGPTPPELVPDPFVGCYQVSFHGRGASENDTTWQLRLYAEPAASSLPRGGQGLHQRRATASIRRNGDPWWRLIPGGFQLHIGDGPHGLHMQFSPSGDDLAGRVFYYSDTHSDLQSEPATADRVPCASMEGSAAGVDSGIRVAEFQQLRWLEGRWRGDPVNGEPFFEAYRMVNDSTLRSYTYADAGMRVPSDSGAITLRGGKVTTGSGGAQWIATELTATRIRFAPLSGVRNSFVWERRPGEAWTATLSWPATSERPAREVVYQMTRLPPR